MTPVRLLAVSLSLLAPLSAEEIPWASQEPPDDGMDAPIETGE